MKTSRYLTLLSILFALSFPAPTTQTTAQPIEFANIRQLKDINPNSWSNPRNFTECNGLVFFSARDGSHGYELWKTNGSKGGTVMVKDIKQTGSGNGLTSALTGTEFVCFKNRLYFTAYDDDHGGELFVSDGTSRGTYMLRNISPEYSSYPSKFYNHNNELLYFRAMTENAGYEPWVTDGTWFGTRMLRDIRSNEAESIFEKSSWPKGFVALGDYVYFVATNAEDNYELWVTNGLTSGTSMLIDINPLGSSDIGPMIPFNNRLYFSANDGQNGGELWSTTGYPGGTSMVQDTVPGAGGSYPINLNTFSFGKFNSSTYLYFTATTPENGRELWRSDGTPEGTQLFQDLNPNGDSIPQNFTPVGDYLYFTAFTPETGRELWRSNGSSPGTLVADIYPGAGSAFSGNNDFRRFVAFGSKLIFAANDGVSGHELWSSEESPANTYRLRDLNPGQAGSNPHDFLQLGQYLFFDANVAGDGEPWVFFDWTVGASRLRRDRAFQGSRFALVPSPLRGSGAASPPLPIPGAN